MRPKVFPWAVIVTAIVLALAVRSQAVLQVGYTLLTADPGTVLPVGTALFTFTDSSGVLISQAGVGAAEPISSGTIFVDEAGTRTGIALANPSPEPVTATLTLRDSSGKEVDRVPRSLGPRQHFASFVFQLFTRIPPNFRGSLTFESDQKVAAITLRETRNSRDEPLYATLPVAAPQTSASSQPVVFPQIAAGDGYTTQLVLINTSGQKLAGKISLVGSDGQPLLLRLQDATASQFSYDIEPNGVYRAELDRPQGLAVGYAVVTPTTGFQSPTGTAIFQYKRNNSLVTETGVAAAPLTTLARIFVDNAGSFTGVAVANPSDQSASLTFTLLDRFGTALDSTTRTLAAHAHMATFANQLFPSIPDSFTGLMDITSSVIVSPVTLVQTINSRGDQILTTLPVADLTRIDAPASLVFPQIAIGSGFSTRLILINRSRVAATSGILGFYQSEGNPMILPLGGSTDSHFKYDLQAGSGRQLLPGNTSIATTISVLEQTSNQNLKEITVNEGKSFRPRIMVLDAAGKARDDVNVSFVSLSTEVATIDSTGNISGKKAGFSTLTLSSAGVLATATIVVVGVNSGTSGFEIVGVAQDPGRKLYLANSADNTILLAQDLSQAPTVYAGVPKSSGLKNDLRLQSLFKNPAYLALHQAQGSLYISDSANNIIRRALPGPSGKLETVAGTGEVGGKDGSSQEATFTNPQGIALDNRGYLWVVDSGNHTIRRINLTKGTVETIAGKAGSAGWVDGRGSIARLSTPLGIALETEPQSAAIERELKGLPPPPISVIVADSANGVLRRVKETGEVETIRTTSSGISTPSIVTPGKKVAAAGAPATFTVPTGVAVDASGNIFVTESNTNRVKTVLYTGDVVAAAQDKTFSGPRGIAISRTGRVVVTDKNNSALEVTYGEPEIRTVAPDRISIRGGATVTIKGNNFAGDTIIVAAGAVIANAIVRDTQTITFIAPALPSGRGTLTVQNRGGLTQSSLLIEASSLQSLPVGYITTVACGTTYVGDGAKATQVLLHNPGKTVVDAAGNLYIADFSNNQIRRVDARTGTITTVAGIGIFGYSGDGGPATAAGLSSPTDVALDVAGNLFIADTFSSRIRKVDAATGIITTVAGNGDPLSSGDGGKATAASIQFPYGIGIDPAGNLWISDCDDPLRKGSSQKVRMVNSATGIITTVAGTGVAGYSGDGGPATAARINNPFDVAFDSAGNAYIAEYLNQRIRKISAATGIITTVAGNGTADATGDGGPATSASLFYPTGIAIDTADNLLIAHTGSVRKVAAKTGVISTVAGDILADSLGDGGPAIKAAIDVAGVSLDAADNLYVSDFSAGRIRKVDAVTGIITTAAGNGDTTQGDNGPATAAQLLNPYAVAVDAAGNLFIADNFNGRIRKVTASTGVITTVAGTGGYGFSGDGRLATAAELTYPFDVAVDSSDNIFIADTFNNRIRKVSAGTGIISTVAGFGTAGSSGDGGPAKTASLQEPHGIAIDRAGNLYIADTLNHRIRKVASATSIITTFAGNGQDGFSGDGGPAIQARLSQPDSIALDAVGNLYIADTWNHRIRKVDVVTGIITTVAGSGLKGYSGDNVSATATGLGYPLGIAIDPAGNLVIADTFDSRVRRVSAASGIITTIAGDGSYSYSGDNGPAISGALYLPSRIAIDSAGNLFIADSLGNRVRAVRGPVP